MTRRSGYREALVDAWGEYEAGSYTTYATQQAAQFATSADPLDSYQAAYATAEATLAAAIRAERNTFHSAITTAEQLQLSIDNALRTANTTARIANHTAVETARAALAFNTTQATGNAHAGRRYSRSVADANRFHDDLTAETSYFTSVATSRNQDRLDQAVAHQNWSLAVSTAFANAHVIPTKTTPTVLAENAIRSSAIQTSNLNRVNAVGPDQTTRAFTLGLNEISQTNSHGSAEVSLAATLDGIEDNHDLTEQALAGLERTLDLSLWSGELSNEATGRQTLTATIGQKRVDLVTNLGSDFLSASLSIAAAEAAYHAATATTSGTWLTQMTPAFTTFVGVATTADHAAMVSAAEAARDFDDAEAAAQVNYVNSWTPLVTTLVNAQAVSGDTLQNSLRDASQAHRGSGASQGQLHGNEIANANGALRLNRAGNLHQFEQRDVTSGVSSPNRSFDATYSVAEADSGMGRGTVVANTDRAWRNWRASSDQTLAYDSALATKLSLKADALATEMFAIAEVGLLPAYDAAVTAAQQTYGSDLLSADITRAIALAAAQVAWIGAGYDAEVVVLTALDAVSNLDFTQHKADFATAKQAWWSGFAANYTSFVTGVTTEWQTEQATSNSETALLATARTTADVTRTTVIAQQTRLANDHLADHYELHEQAVADADFNYQITAAEMARSNDEIELLSTRYGNSSPELNAYLANPHPTQYEARSTFDAAVRTPSVAYDVLSESANFWLTSETNSAETAHAAAVGLAFQSYLTNVSEGTRLRRTNVATQASAFEQSWSGSYSGMTAAFAASSPTPWATFEMAKANAEGTRTGTLAPARATQDAGIAQADHDFLSALAGDMATFLSASTEQDNARSLAQATADLSAVLARGEGLLATTDEWGTPIPVDWTTLISLPGGATGLPTNYTPVDPNADPPADDSMPGGSGDEPPTPFLRPFELPLPPDERPAPFATGADLRDLPDDHRESSNGINTSRGQLAPTHGSTGDWINLYAVAYNDPQNSDDPPVQPKRTVTKVERQEKENGTRININPDEMLAGGPDELAKEIIRNRKNAQGGWFDKLIVAPGQNPDGTYNVYYQNNGIFSNAANGVLIGTLDPLTGQVRRMIPDSNAPSGTSLRAASIVDVQKEVDAGHTTDDWDDWFRDKEIVGQTHAEAVAPEGKLDTGSFPASAHDPSLTVHQSAAMVGPLVIYMAKQVAKQVAVDALGGKILGVVVKHGGLVVKYIAKNGKEVSKRLVGAAADQLKKITKGNLDDAAKQLENAVESEVKAMRGAMSFADELSVSEQAARRHLRRNVPGTGGQAHHIIPFESRSHELVQRAARGGFNMNGLNNGIRLDLTQHLGSHPRYNAAVTKKLDKILRANPNISDIDAAQLLQEFAEQLRAGLTRSSSMLH